MNDPSKVESILLAALEQATAEARSAYLDDACKGSPDLREHVNRLLAAHPKAVEFLEQPAVPAGEKTAGYVPTREESGAIVAGRYKLLEKIGEGGMGEVWVADQHEPIRRRVALKLIKPGMDSRSVLARFEAERQALAVMDHPNIAKVFDAGTTDDGRPYFVMELVMGTPITEFCDARRLTPKHRLELFVPVCQAIQHAHTKGIIHRDIKPSNVLVALHDERPVPKVIDFGVAKAVGQQLTEKTIYTGFGALVGTPAYMAPEQATFNQLDIDTRADVYALGVLLYELLAGSPPVEPERMKKAALDEVLRLVRDEEPPRPSQRLSTSQAKASIAATRQSDPNKLAQFIRGELDWIVMKALEKDRNRRYETANSFAADVQRYLSGEQVQAVPPSRVYKLKKFARKNRMMLSTTAAFAVLLLTAVGVSSWLARQAIQARAVAEEERIEAEALAKEAQEAEERASRNYGFAVGAMWAGDEERQASQLAAARLQVDLDTAEIQTERVVGTLKLARTLKNTPENYRRAIKHEHFEFTSVEDEVEAHIRRSLQELREFMAAVVLVTGQEFAPLTPPITHDGIPVSQANCEISPNHLTLLTCGADGTARLWDLWTARQIAILRRENEMVIHYGYSSDGLTIFTVDDSGVARFWDAANGMLRAQAQLPPDRYAEADNEALEKLTHQTQLDVWQIKRIDRHDCIIMGTDRLLTRQVIVKKRPDTGNVNVFDQFFSGPTKLWDTTTGRLVTQLDVPDSAIEHLQFVGAGRWITANEGRSNLVVFSAENGRQVGRLAHPAGEEVRIEGVSPSGRRIATITETAGRERHLRLWDSSSWKMESPPMPLKSLPSIGPAPKFQFLTDDVFAITAVPAMDTETWDLYRYGMPQPITTVVAYRLSPPVGELLLVNDGVIIDIRTGQRLIPPAGRKFHPSLAKFAADGRFVFTNVVIDTQTDKQISVPWEQDSNSGFVAGVLPGFGMVGTTRREGSVEIRLLPSPDYLNLLPAQLELWAQVAVRGELGPEGEFVKWNEQTWEKKRQELATFPAPYQNFPFPGHVATDRLHWLRAEYNVAPNDAERQRLAQELLRRAEANGGQAEAIRWRAARTPVVPKADPAALPASK